MLSTIFVPRRPAAPFVTPLIAPFAEILNAGFKSKTRSKKPDPPVYSGSRAKRFPMTTKRANKNYYKGNGARKEGFITHKGCFILQPELCTELVVPDLRDFPLKAYISNGVKKHIRETSPDFN